MRSHLLPMDRLTPEQRSALMARIGQKNTKPELAVRSLAHRLGYRFRLHRRGLPGTPDLVFPSRRKAVWVHGCFWHWHDACRCGRLPKSRTDYWRSRLLRNRERDAANLAALEAQGWRALVVWECEIRNLPAVETRLSNFLGPPGCSASHLDVERIENDTGSLRTGLHV